MRRLIPQILRSAADAGGGGGAADPGGEAGASNAGAADAGGGTGGQPSPSAGEPAAGADPSPAAGDFYRPQGLPDHMVGKDQNETMDKMSAALKGYRDKDASSGVPETPEAYGEFSAEVPADIKGHLDTLKADPLFGRVAAKALELKVPVAAYQSLTQEFLSVAAEMGMMEPVIDEAAEKAALVPESAKHLPEAEQTIAREKRMNDNFAFLDAMVARGGQNGLQKDDAEYAKAMLGDSAKGHRVFEWMRSTSGGGESGSGPAMDGGASAGATSARAELSRRAALPENTPGDPKFNPASAAQLDADYERLIGK